MASERNRKESAEWAPEEIRRRLGQLTPADLDDTSRNVIAELVNFNRVATLSPSLAAIDVFRGYVDGLMPRLQARLDGATPPISRSIRTHAYLVEKLLKELGLAYVRLVRAGRGSWLSMGKKTAPRHVPLVRAMDLISRRLILSYRLYARPPRSAWLGLHELYRVALKEGLAMRDLSAPHSNAQAIYRKALLLAFAEPSRLGAGDLYRVRDYIARFGDSAELVPPKAKAAPPNEGLFVVNVAVDAPGQPFAKLRAGVPSRQVLLLVTTHLVDRIGYHLKQLESGVSPAQLGLPQEPESARYRDLLQRLATNWTGAARRRAPRMHFRPRAELHIGFSGVWRMLEPPIETGDLGGQDFSMGSTSIGSTSMSPPPGRREGASNEWAILNESPGGFALRHLRGVVPAMRIGDLVGVRSRERGDTFVCLVRWIQSEAADHLDLGLQQLAPRFAPVTYRRSDGRSVTHHPLLFAPSSPQFNRVPVLVAPAKLFAPGAEFGIQYLGLEIALRAERVLESTPHAELLQVVSR